MHITSLSLLVKCADSDDDDDWGNDEDFEKAGLGSSGGVKSKLISRLNFG